ncbi:hypothetical protein SAICODRAFT_168444 [Saitoella complicata NRRL Y-17804]|uniref:uncharacterized protein n=1 Tax=Saitoella complicata (strain BCRC 22490 / CBS 7301 / JCM 7358 / NBRC 10748 / NRRL Y-17804) TaxID=698492 RepID=UPI000867C331|nr:uncharacterized protein SAICODRAFT_168444 [Saitoella complicata NRRL Y-17804]ODQ50753.1 hypothetical protein SAICODRAFT_168444 [Saitoella complicata NRRL Y-17804]
MPTSSFACRAFPALSMLRADSSNSAFIDWISPPLASPPRVGSIAPTSDSGKPVPDR